MQLVLSSGLLNVSIFPLTLPLFIGYPLILLSRTNLHVFATTACLLTLRPTYLTFLPFTPLPVSFAQVLTTLSSVVHLSVAVGSMYGVSRRYDGSRPQSVFVLACVRLWLCKPIRDAQSRPQTCHRNVSMFDEGWIAFRLILLSIRASHLFSS